MRLFSSKKLLWISGIASLLSQLGIFLILYPTPASEIFQHQVTLSPEVFQGILSHWGTDGIDRFIAHYYLDFFHPIIYFVFLSCCLASAWPKGNRTWLWVFPLIAALSDEIENLCQLPITLGSVQIQSVWFYVGAMSSRNKWLFVGFTLIAISIGLFKTLTLKRKSRI